LGYAIMVEGYFDFAQVVQAGVQPAVAACGTAVTAQQARLLGRFASKVIVSFDPDAAGQNASARTGELLLGEGLEVNVAVLPPGQDPDTCVRERGGAYYVDQLRKSQRYVDYVLDKAAAARDLSRNAQRKAFLSDMLAVAARMPDAAARDEFADRVAHRAGITEDVVRSDLRRLAVRRRTTLDEAVSESIEPAVTHAEKGLIWATMRDTTAALHVLADTEPADFEGLATEPILRVARTLVEWPADAVPQALLERVSAGEAALAERIARAPHAPAGVADCVATLRRRRFRRELGAIQEAIARCQRAGTPGAEHEMSALLQRKQDLLQRPEALGG
jgi:DNA primase